ncbi:MAG: quinone-dependent dihydroorotate dehydrogenase [Rhodobacteraceae bacterium]|nr:quinone-dependent dihydroorotate dehydrogenase [Paracoccaceae bacterium]
MKKALQRLAIPALHLLPPEAAHAVALRALRLGLAPGNGPVSTHRLASTLAGLTLPNPIGLAAGFDKNAVAIGPLLKAGFGFIEVGAATPHAQPGNPRPRLFRLTPDGAVINRFGFNNQGVRAISARLSRSRSGIAGLNLGANKNSNNRTADFAKVLTSAGPYIDFATVNVSSPNTERLRDLQGKAALKVLLSGVMEARATLPRPIPVFLKIAPDLDSQALEDIVDVVMETGISGIIATNTTLARDGLDSAFANEVGGLSGQPLFEKSTRILAQLSVLTKGKLPLIGVGGVSNAAQAFAKIRAGASAIQLYTALVYQGIGLAAEIALGLDDLLKQHGYSNITEAVGTGRKGFL